MGRGGRGGGRPADCGVCLCVGNSGAALDRAGRGGLSPVVCGLSLVMALFISCSVLRLAIEG